MHIGLICPGLYAGKGGAERACVNLASAMMERGHTVTILAYRVLGEQAAYPLPATSQVVLVDYSVNWSSIANLRAQLISLAIDVCVTFTSTCDILFWAASLMGSGIPLVCSEHTSPEYAEKRWNRPGRLAALSSADMVVLLFPEYLDSLPSPLHKRARVIGNVAPIERGGAALEAKPPFLLLSLGRLHPIKQVGLLVTAFAKIADRFPEWNLEIWGRGEENFFLKALITSHGLNQRTRLCGETDTPEECFRRASLFCIPSRYEGFPNTVLESFASGVPAVGFAGCPGVNLLIKDKKNGLLAPMMDAESLTESLFTIMSDDALRAECGKGAKTTAAEYAPEVVYTQWEHLLLKTAAKKGRTVMDSFGCDPLFSRARLSCFARREHLLRKEGPSVLQLWRSICK